MTAAEAYERFLVPAIFGPWAEVALSLSPPSSGAAVLDVACGTGIGARLAARIVGPSGRVAGLDSDEGMLEVARAVAAGASGASVAWRHGNALALPLPDEAFDVPSAQDFVDWIAAGAPTTRHNLALLKPPDRAGFDAFVTSRLAGYRTPAGLTLPSARNIVVADR